MNADRLWHQYNAFRSRKVKQFRPAIYKALQAQLKYFIDTGDMNLPMQPILDVLTELYSDIAKNWGFQTYLNVMREAGLKAVPVQVKRRAPLGFNQAFVDAILEFFRTDLLNTVFNITETTKEFIRQELAKGIQEGLSLDEIANSIVTNGFTRTRATLIARTEIGKASNVAEQAGTDKTGLQTNKEWISVRDHRTRRDHVTVDGQVQPDGKPFIVGVEQYQMQRPGANVSADGRKIPAKEVVNCRCVVGREVLRGKNGLPLRKNVLSIP